MRQINEIIIHCTATFPKQNVTVADITRWHKQRGFQTIGYHFVISLDGLVHPGRPVEEIGKRSMGAVNPEKVAGSRAFQSYHFLATPRSEMENPAGENLFGSQSAIGTSAG